MIFLQKFFSKIGQAIHDHALLSIIVTLILTVLIGLGLPQIKMDMSNAMFVNKNSSLYKNTNEYQKHFGGQTFVISVKNKSGDVVNSDTFKKLNGFTEQIDKNNSIHSTTSIVNILNEQLDKAKTTKGSGSGFGTNNPKLQKAINEQMTAKQQKQLQADIQKSFTSSQKQKIQQYTQGILTTQQKMAAQQAMQAAVAKGANPAQLQANPDTMMQAIKMSKRQTAQIQAYSMSILTQKQKTMMAAETLKMLPKVQNMDNNLIHQFIYSNDGKVSKSMNQILPKNGKYALVTVTMAAGGSMNSQKAMYKKINTALKDNHLKSDGIKTRIGGMPAVSGTVGDEMTHSMMIMLVLAVVLMIVILALIFPVRRRLLPLIFVLPGLIWTFGIMGWAHISLTMATMATLPIIIGLGTDFGVQFLNRYEEEFRRDHDVMWATTETITHTGPAVGTAVTVMIFSFLTMYIAKAPMMHYFGLTLAIGVAACYIVELVFMFSVLALRDRKADVSKLSKIKTENSWLSKALSKYATWVAHHAVIVLLVGIVLGGIGFFYESSIPVETNMMKMIPQSMPAVKDTDAVQKVAGSTTNLTYLVKSDHKLTTADVKYLDSFGRKEANKYHHIQSVTSLATTLKDTSGNSTLPTNNAAVNTGIKNMPKVMKDTLITNDQKYTSIAFKIDPGLGSNESYDLMKDINHDIKNEPKGIKIVTAGDQSMALQGVKNMTANHGLIIIAGLAIIFIVLLLVYRNIRDAFYPLMPIVIVLGLSPLTLKLMNTSYNPVTIALSSLVLGIGTEFTILILERFMEEEKKNGDTLTAIQTAIGSVGQAITVSGLTVIGGFSTLMFISFPVLRSFGLITVLDTAYSLICALTILPAMMYLFRSRKKNK
ncbi:efflux RND transporter permease subunit [Lentilactobacillus sp. SPB1-3]|uniref:RND family transporter n=1 Tax=Lentilactobacillus terminaliae TaxID=3003483 RepID=A0ACD5DDE5_9LACO|nr:hydrophobe/amphiphile efflux-3 (HAE3) family transporter [Lentilactobacillus sp. SPB1-3]MCZ0977984.1 hydrophobe/amphiphile efflux-3 (HAE3) family transporter [Lentilactobacillus sp. SPB1-3]